MDLPAPARTTSTIAAPTIWTVLENAGIVACDFFTIDTQLVLIAQDLTAWTQALCFDGALKIAEPKRLRHRVFHAAAAFAHSGGQVIVRFQRTWPWVDDIVTAFTRPRVALPS